MLLTDDSGALAPVARQLGVDHHSVNIAAGARANGVRHIQNIIAFVTRLRGWLRRFKGVAAYYLDIYLGWFRGLNRSPGFNPHPASPLAFAVRV